MLSRNTLRVPSIQQFLAEVVDALAERRSALVLLPSALEPEDIWPSVRSQLWQSHLDAVDLSLLGEPASSAPLPALVKLVSFDWPERAMPHTLTTFLEHADLPDVIHVSDLDRVSEDVRGTWLRFLAQWAAAIHARVGEGKPAPALCLVAGAASVLNSLPESNVFLAIHWWGGFPSTLETHLLCRLEGEGQPWDAAARWREHLLASLAGSDLQLIQALWDGLHLTPEAMGHQLELFAMERGWTPALLREWGANDLIDRPIMLQARRNWTPPPPLQRLWSNGAISATLERGLELHSAAVAALGRDDQIRHRLWRGQAELLLPLIDHSRLMLCNLLTSTYGSGWPVRWRLPDSQKEEAEVRRDPLACGWGHIEYLLKQGYLRPFAAWLSLATRARYIRNELAHYRPVSFTDYEQLLADVERLHQPGMLA